MLYLKVHCVILGRNLNQKRNKPDGNKPVSDSDSVMREISELQYNDVILLIKM